MIEYLLTVVSIALGVIGVLFLFLGCAFRRAYLRELFIDQKIASMKNRKRKKSAEEDVTGYNDHLKRTYFKMIWVGSLILLLGILLFSLKTY